uniref:Uncharacterized protein n=1 Tax=Arundo donax TaxID=35708 RepID=A0A0A8ZW56_ARUDO
MYLKKKMTTGRRRPLGFVLRVPDHLGRYSHDLRIPKFKPR